MTKGKWLTTSLFWFVLVALLVLKPSVQADTISVCSGGCDFASIQAAIDAADPDDVINIAPGIYQGSLTIDKDLTLDGAGAGSTTLTSESPGAGKSSIVSVVDGATAVIEGVTITGGRKENTGSLLDAGGGGIYNAGSLTLRLSTVAGNEAVGSNEGPNAYGGGIFNCGIMTIIDSSIRNNTVAANRIDNSLIGGSAIGGLAQGGGIYNINGSLTLVNSTVSSNVVAAGNGIGGAGGNGQGGRGEGGGIYTWAWNGGGCRPPGAAVSLTNSTVSSNEVSGGTGVSGQAIGGMGVGGIGGSAAGGGIFNLGGFSGADPLSSILLSSSTISSNSVTGGEGIDGDGPDGNPEGGDSFGGGITSNLSATLVNTIITDNSATGGRATDNGIPLPQFNGSGSGGGLNHGGGTFFQTATFSIVTGNEPDECSDPITSQGNNYESNAACGFTKSTDRQDEGPVLALLGPLADNGGPTLTHALANALPVDYGKNTNCPGTDQRGNLRPINGFCDVGAFESSSNVAPVLNASGSPALNPIEVDNFDNQGTLVADIIASVLPLDMITDANAQAKEGLAIVGTANANGFWEYWDPDDESGWTKMPNLSEGTALLLPADDEARIRFVPNAGFCGMVDSGITFRAWDQLGSYEDNLTSTSINGGSTPFSSSRETAVIFVYCTAIHLPFAAK